MKTERVFREVLMGVLAGRSRFSQKELSKSCRVSIGLVNKVIRNLQDSGALQIVSRGFQIIDPSKILLQWAATRKISRELKAFSVKGSVEIIEKNIPSGAIFTAFSGWRLATGRTPADYGEVYVYIPKQKKYLFDAWLKENTSKGRKNLYVIFTEDTHLIKFSKKGIAPVPQIFVDIYSIGSMMSRYFLKDIIEKYPVLELI